MGYEGYAERIAAALGRMAAADERRNEILEAELAERKAAWEASEARSEAALERLLQPQPAEAADPWRDLPEDHPERRDRLAALEEVATAALNLCLLAPRDDAYSLEDRRRLWTADLSELLDHLPRAGS